MKCSKCGYLGFDSVDRCRNCGYEFSLAESYDIPDLAIRSQSPALPLFVSPLDDDTPLITTPSPPRPPLAVRRSTPDSVRLRAASTPRTPTAALPLEAPPAASVPPHPPAAIHPAPGPVHYEDAGVVRRIAASALDLIVLLLIDLVVVYFTMQICGVSVDELGMLPRGPLVAFLLVQNVGYLVAFTAGGQTLGKMAAGIKVIARDCDASMDVACALKRTMLSIVLAVPAGLGFLPALFDPQHRGLHDRFAGTRVVRASA